MLLYNRRNGGSYFIAGSIAEVVYCASDVDRPCVQRWVSLSYLLRWLRSQLSIGLGAKQGGLYLEEKK